MCLCCCVLGLGSSHFFSPPGYDDFSAGDDFFDDLGYGNDIERLLDELDEDEP